MKKKLLLIAALIMGVAQSFAQFEAGGLIYNIQASGTEVRCSGFVLGQETATLVVPEKVTDPGTSIEYTVTVIAGGAFFNNAPVNDAIITSISLPGSLTDVGVNAFRGLPNLTSVTFAPSNPDVPLLKFEDAVFQDCTSLVSIDLTGTNINLGHGSGAVNSKKGRNIFRDCTALKSFTLKNNSQTTRIFTNAFRGCTSLETVDLSGTEISAISPGAFENCNAIKTMYLGSDTPPSTVSTSAFELVSLPLTNATLFVPTAAGVSAFSADTTYDWDALFTTISAGTTLSSAIIEADSNLNLYYDSEANKLKSPKTVKEAKVYSVLGKEVKAFYNQTEFDVSSLSNGVYFFKAQFENDKVYNVRFVKL